MMGISMFLPNFLNPVAGISAEELALSLIGYTLNRVFSYIAFSVECLSTIIFTGALTMSNQEDQSPKDKIMMALAAILEKQPDKKVTTAALARNVGVSEAALYRHFASKAKIFEALIDYIEKTILSRINRILSETLPVADKLIQIMSLIFVFCEKNPGLSRILNGDALIGENPKLHKRVDHFFKAVETQMRKAVKKEEALALGNHTGINTTSSHPLLPLSNEKTVITLLMALLEGKIRQYIRTQFRQKPTELWHKQVNLIMPVLLFEK